MLPFRWSAERLEPPTPIALLKQLKGSYYFLVSACTVDLVSYMQKTAVKRDTIRAEEIIRNWRSHQKSNMHFVDDETLILRNEIRIENSLRAPNSSIAIRCLKFSTRSVVAWICLAIACEPNNKQAKAIAESDDKRPCPLAMTDDRRVGRQAQ